MAKMSLKKSKTPRFYIDFDVKNDPFYLEGFERGVEDKMTSIIENMFLEGSFSIERVVKLTRRTEDFVLSIQNRLIQEGKLSPSS